MSPSYVIMRCKTLLKQSNESEVKEKNVSVQIPAHGAQDPLTDQQLASSSIVAQQTLMAARLKAFPLSSPPIYRDSPISRLITRTALGAHSLPGLRTQCMARTLTGKASIAAGTADPTIAGEPITRELYCVLVVVSVVSRTRRLE